MAIRQNPICPQVTAMCRFDGLGNYEEKFNRGWALSSFDAEDIFEMLPEPPPERVPFEEVDKHIEYCFGSHSLFKEFARLIVAEALAQWEEKKS